MTQKSNNDSILENEIKHIIKNTGIVVGTIIKFYSIKNNVCEECVTCFVQINQLQPISLKFNCYYYEEQIDLYENVINYIINNKIGIYDCTIFRNDKRKVNYDVLYFNIIDKEILLKLL